MSIQIFILGNLMEENSYPYKLKKQLSTPIPLDNIIHLTESKLYYHFEALTKQQLIEPVEIIKEEHRPDKQVFAITDKGRQELPKKIYQVFEKAETVTDLIVGLHNIRYVDIFRVIALLEQKLVKMKDKDAALSSLYYQVAVDGAKKEFVDFLNDYYLTRRQQDIDAFTVIIEKLQRQAADTKSDPLA